MNNTNIIEAENIKKYFKKVKAVNGISLSVKKGEFVAILGPNGAGKTTMVEMIEGIQEPDSGSIAINNKSWRKNRHELHKIIGLSLQETPFIEKLTTYETLRLFASFYKLGKQRIDEILSLTRLQEKNGSYVKNLSGGQRQRLALGIAFINQPEILLLDEPTTGLDPAARREIWDILNDLKQKHNTSMVLTTHYMEEAEYLCDRIIIFDKGKILAQGTLNELLAMNKSKEIIEFSVKEDFAPDILQKENFEHVHWDQNKRFGRIMVHSIVDEMSRFLQIMKQNDYTLLSFECRKMTLDDLFLNLTGRTFNE